MGRMGGRGVRAAVGSRSGVMELAMVQGQRVGPYSLVRRLGCGAFGEVWLADHTDLQVQRAIKFPTGAAFIRQL